MLFFIKVLVSALIITLSTEIAKRSPTLGGLILALPISSIIAFAVMGFEGTDPVAFTTYAKTVFILVPVSLIFFLPFILPWFQTWPVVGKFALGISALTLCNFILIKVNFIKV